MKSGVDWSRYDDEDVPMDGRRTPEYGSHSEPNGSG